MSLEVTFVEGMVTIRGSKDPAGPVLQLSVQEWAAFLRAVHDGEFSPPEGQALADDVLDGEFDPDRLMADRIRQAFESVIPTISATELIERAEADEHAQRRGHRSTYPGAASPRRAKARERIVDAATRLFYAEGIQATGIHRIIAEADVAPMTLYRHFGGKDELVAATLERWSGQWLGWLRREVDRGSQEPGARLEGLWDALEKWFASEGFRGSYIANAASELRSRQDHPAQRAIAEHQRDFRGLLEDLVQRSDAVEVTVVATELQVLIDGAIAVAAVEGDPSAARGVRALATGSVAAGLYIPQLAG
jgi:AcrR family transcriptional regulator